MIFFLQLGHSELTHRSQSTICHKIEVSLFVNMVSTTRAKSSIAQRALKAQASAKESESPDDNSSILRLLVPREDCVFCRSSPRTHIFVPCVSVRPCLMIFI